MKQNKLDISGAYLSKYKLETALHLPIMQKHQNIPDTIIIIDDDKNFRSLVQRWLEKADFQTETFADGLSCFSQLNRILPVCVCLDLNLPDAGGLEILRKLKMLHKHLPVIILTGDSKVEKAVKATKLGAYDYLVKPIDRQRLLNSINNAVEKYQMSLRLTQLERESSGKSFKGILGKSSAMKKLFSVMDKISASDISLLIRGESGTGKELVANAIHGDSGRKKNSFVALNCAAIPESLQESELFGHEKGAFTGAESVRKGRFELANNGTLFLDEVAELSLGLQAKLLRVLQEKNFSRLGSSEEIHSDFRLIAASHKNLSDEVEAGRFREDLFYRIAVYELDIPPLRERESDILLLADYFLHKYGKPTFSFSRETIEILSNYAFPGNVRELENYVQRALITADNEVIMPDDLPERVKAAVPLAITETEINTQEDLEETITGEINIVVDANDYERKDNFPAISLNELEKIAIESSIERHNGNLSKVTKELEIGRTTLYRKIKKYNIKN